MREAPHKPQILFDTDTSNFDPIDPDKLRNDDDSDGVNGERTSDDNNRSDYHGFYEFTFRRFFDDAGHPYITPPSNAGNGGNGGTTSSGASFTRMATTDDNENPSGPVYV